MIGFLTFYYLFSLFFMFGYVNIRFLVGESIGLKIAAFIVLLITAPFLFPFNVGAYIYKNT